MRFHLLAVPSATSPSHSFEADGPASFRAAVAGIQPDRPDRRYVIAAEIPAADGTPYALKPRLRWHRVLTVAVGLAGAAEADTMWPRIVDAVEAVDDWLRMLRGIGEFATDGMEPERPTLRLVD